MLRGSVSRDTNTRGQQITETIPILATPYVECINLGDKRFYEYFPIRPNRLIKIEHHRASSGAWQDASMRLVLHGVFSPPLPWWTLLLVQNRSCLIVAMESFVRRVSDSRICSAVQCRALHCTYIMGCVLRCAALHTCYVFLTATFWYAYVNRLLRA